jgi:hypothetical protein
VTRLDDLALSKLFAPIAGLAEHRLGLGRWHLALECLNGHLAFYLAGLAFGIAGKGADDGIFADVLIALAWLALIEVVRGVARRQASSSLGVQSARMGEWHFRLILLASLPVSVVAVKDIGNACYTVSLFLLLCHLAFKACDAPPPQRRRQLAFSRF